MIMSSQAGLKLISIHPTTMPCSLLPALTKGMHLGTGRAGDCCLLTGGPDQYDRMDLQVPVRASGGIPCSEQLPRHTAFGPQRAGGGALGKGKGVPKEGWARGLPLYFSCGRKTNLEVITMVSQLAEEPWGLATRKTQFC